MMYTTREAADALRNLAHSLWVLMAFVFGWLILGAAAAGRYIVHNPVRIASTLGLAAAIPMFVWLMVLMAWIIA